MKTSKTNPRSILYILAISMAISSCTKEMCDDPNNLAEIGVECKLNADATLPDIDINQKAYLDPSSRKVLWASNDQISVNGYTLSAYQADNTSLPPRASFSGTTYGKQSGDRALYWAVYPKELAATSGGGTVNSAYGTNTLTYTMPATQTFNKSDNTMSGNTYMAGFVNVPSTQSNFLFSMKNLGAVIHLQLKAATNSVNTRISKIEFTQADNKPLSGNFTVNNTFSTISPAGSNSNKLTVYLKDEYNHDYITLSTSTQDIYVILPPTDTTVTIRVYSYDGYFVEKSTTKKLERNSIYLSQEITTSFPQFSVSDSKKVIFAPGNLRYQASTGTWQFARLQYLYIGNHRGNNVSSNRSSQSDTIDLFAWGTSGWSSGASKYMPYEFAAGNGNYYPGGNANNDLTGSYAQADWGWHNSIYNPKTGNTEPVHTWRTPTFDEWNYLIATRSGDRWVKATVAGVSGLIILPDNWSRSTYSLSSYNGGSYESNTINATSWTILENAGCVFLPGADHAYYNNGGIVVENGKRGWYWSSTHTNANYSGQLYFITTSTNADLYGTRDNLQSVRLVRDLN